MQGFIHGSGGLPLNFKVVGGTTQPASTKENTIWVNTDQKITSWIFNPTEPENPAEGMVLIPTGAFSSAPFNVLKKNCIQVYPLSAKQYVSGAWVDKTAKIYQGGAWVGLTTTIFDGSAQYESITGGWTTENSWAYGSQNTVSLGIDGITHSSQASYSSMGVTRTINKIDLSGVSKIQATVDVSTAFESMYLAVDLTFSTANTFVASTKFTADGVIELDVSEINEKCYIGVVFANGYDGRRVAKATLNKVVIS